MNPVRYNFSPLAFYPSQPTDWIPDYAFGNISPVIMKKGQLLPFQLVYDSYQYSIWNVEAYKYEPVSRTFTKAFDLDKSYFKLDTVGELTILAVTGGIILDARFEEGLYSIKIRTSNDGVNTTEIWSDFICMTSRVEDYVHIKYTNSFNLVLNNGLIAFKGGFSFEAYLNTQIGKPEYEFEEEGDERLGYTFIESVTSKKKYSFAFFGNEHLCDALRIVKLCDTISIDNKYLSEAEENFSPISFDMEVSWEEQGDLALVVCTFEIDNIVSAVGHFSPYLLGHSFNDDYNDDYDSFSVEKEVCTVSADFQGGSWNSDKPLASDLVLTGYENRTDDPETYERKITLSKGSTSGNFNSFEMVAEEPAPFLSPSADDTYRYVLIA